METKKPDDSKKADLELDAKRTPAEKRLLDAFYKKMEMRRDSPKLKVKYNPGEGSNISVAGEDKLVSTVALLEAFGTTCIDFQSFLMCELVDAACSGNKTKPYDEATVNGVIAAVHGIAPRDETETMLAVQMVATHSTAMRVLRQLKNSDSIKQQDSNGNLAIKLLRTYTMQIEALQRYRGKGQQKMTVEHVHVHPGGKAIVGNVNQPEGGRVSKKTEEQPHAKQIDYAPMPEMSSPNKEGQRVPVARDD